MTYSEFCDLLRDAGIENADLEAMLLIGFFCKKSRAEILANRDFKYAEQALLDAVDKRCGRYPLQYIFGEWDFFGETYTVNESCLIPRSDTELLVEYAIENLPRGARFADLCTGSGCIAVSTLVHRPDTCAIGLDLFEATAQLARQNADRNGVGERFEVVCADLLADNPFENESFDAIISNPPYIRTAVVDTLQEELFCEPRAALDGGDDGLVFYKRILSDYKSSLKDGGFILFEIGFDQGEDIRNLATQYGFDCELQRDLSGNVRMAVLR